ncbi:hypothetical protein BCR44DRAFT_34940 [Catenaria anguillulae PL171]|uniref:Uncharacterized protein n=1 Tax=Catenaria anguillulae PL171 TaxID=765915 RepID=A0A1Y2HW96_9FUNG|nr:hypothetical protein BCR44DRAFT_34940 [Catenaria anguillulae PL171]
MASIPKNLTGVLMRIERWMRPAESKLLEKLESNPLYPFERLGPNIYRLSVRYRKLYVAVLGLVVSVLFIIVWTSTNLVSDNNLFLFPLFGVIISLASIHNYRPRRIYTLNMETMEYTFAHDNTLYTRGALHNVYIRLKREARGSTGARSARYYYLVFNGFQVDQRRISGSSTNVNELRRLGQLIAANLNLNYFDEANSSEHHVIRHLRAPQYRGIQLPPGMATGHGGIVGSSGGGMAGSRGGFKVSGMLRKDNG